jgi:3-hydroxymyristoyl/3-hydroxydecanoyl-(acyl carrier protein) dehydratase
MRSGMQTEGSFAISADHPCLPGHFSSGPIVPGVVLLDEVFALILAAYPGHMVVGMPSVKFVRPVLPGQPVAMSWREAGDRRIAFTCSVAAQVVVHGSMLIGPVAPQSDSESVPGSAQGPAG